MSKHNYERHAQLGNSVFDAAHRLCGGSGVARVPDDEEFAEPSTKKLLGPNA
jgi:hypothetical protein